MHVNNQVLYTDIDRRSSMYEVGRMGLGDFEEKALVQSRSMLVYMN